MKTYAKVNYSTCKHAAAAKVMNKGLEALMATNNWDLPKAIEEISKKSGFTKLTIQQIRAGDRDPKRSAEGVAKAIFDLGGPKIIFPFQVVATSMGSNTPTPATSAPMSPHTIALPTPIRGFRIEVIGNVTEVTFL